MTGPGEKDPLEVVAELAERRTDELVSSSVNKDGGATTDIGAVRLAALRDVEVVLSAEETDTGKNELRFPNKDRSPIFPESYMSNSDSFMGRTMF